MIIIIILTLKCYRGYSDKKKLRGYLLLRHAGEFFRRMGSDSFPLGEGPGPCPAVTGASSESSCNEESPDPLDGILPQSVVLHKQKRATGKMKHLKLSHSGRLN